MKAKLKTETLQTLLKNAMKGVGGNGKVLLTCCIGLTCNNHILSITSWDGTNYLKVSAEKVDCGDFNVTVMADRFSKLVEKTTSENIELTLKDKYLEFKGNGTVKIELPVDEEGELLVYPSVDAKNSKPTGTIKLQTVKSIIDNCKRSLAKTLERPMLTGYFCGDTTLSTNANMASCNKVSLFGSDLLISQELMQLLAICDLEEINYWKKDNKVTFQTSNVIIEGYVLDGIENYPVEPIKALFEFEFPGKVSIPRDELFNSIDRISIFVAKKEEGITLKFLENGVQITNKEGSINELVKYTVCEKHVPFDCPLELNSLLETLGTVSEKQVTIHYGHEDCIKIDSNSSSAHAITLLQEQE